MSELNPLGKISVFSQRTVVTLIGVPVVIAVVWFGYPWFTIFGAAWGSGATWEYYNILKRSKGLAPLTYFGLLWAVLLIVSPNVVQLGGNWYLWFAPTTLLTGGVVVSLIYLLVRRDKDQAFANWSWTMAGLLYIGWLLSYMVALRGLNDGRGWVFMAIACTFASDICAYLGGRAVGRHRLAPYVSPNKTWEGTVSGLLGAAAIGALANALFHLPIGFGGAVLLGVLVSVFGQVGDLVKSLFKRNMAVKDSSRVIPGHGGFLDRMDSMAFAGVTVYFFLYFGWNLIY
jgi:phosphatidate cytidylyltransferase